MPMNQEIKAQWVEALYSDDYEQGQEYLTKRQGDTFTFCCLGVLCDLAVKAGVDVTVKEHKEAGFDYVVYNSKSGTLPRSVMEWAGLTESSPAVNYEGGQIALTDLNDGTEDGDGNVDLPPQPFSEIAACIEASL